MSLRPSVRRALSGTRRAGLDSRAGCGGDAGGEAAVSCGWISCRMGVGHGFFGGVGAGSDG